MATCNVLMVKGSKKRHSKAMGADFVPLGDPLGVLTSFPGNFQLNNVKPHRIRLFAEYSPDAEFILVLFGSSNCLIVRVVMYLLVVSVNKGLKAIRGNGFFPHFG